MPILGSQASRGGGTPTAPTSVSATAGNASASVSFTASSYRGKSGSVTYTAISSPGNITASGTSPITVTGLTNGTAYTFTVRATSSTGETATSSASSSVTPVVPLTVTGGSLTSDATYYYRTFTGNGTLGVSGGTVTADVAIVGGGGGAGSSNLFVAGGVYVQAFGGNGGGGGGRLLSSQSIASNQAITIGAGGPGGTLVSGDGPWVEAGTKGGDTIFGGFTATGGGFGGRGLANAGGAGGSGGGAGLEIDYFEGGPGYYTNTGGAGNEPSTSPAQGFNGGNSTAAVGASGAGGGAGSAASNTTAGSPVNYFGTNYGAGAVSAAGSSALTGPSNSGNGGGSSNSSGVAGKNGGSGIVVIRYTRSQVGG
jgi:hypothetical protein